MPWPMRFGPPPRIITRRWPGCLGRRLVLVLVGRIVVGRVGLELGGAGVDRLERGHDAAALALLADVHLGRVPNRGQLPIGKAELLGAAKRGVVALRQAADARRSCSSISTISWRFSRNQGSMSVNS